MLRSMQSTRSPSNWNYFKCLSLSFRGALSVSLVSVTSVAPLPVALRLIQTTTFPLSPPLTHG